MFKVMVSGKPSGYNARPNSSSKMEKGWFVLHEYGYFDGHKFERDFWVYVPEHKLKWVEGLVQKGYTIVVEGALLRSSEKAEVGTEPTLIIWGTEFYSL